MGVPLHAWSDKIFEMLGALLRSICPVEGLIWFSSMASQNIESGDLTVLIGCSSSCAGCRYYVSVVDMDIIAIGSSCQYLAVEDAAVMPLILNGEANCASEIENLQLVQFPPMKSLRA